MRAGCLRDRRKKRSRGWCLDYCDVCASPVPDGEAPIKEAKAKEQRVFGPLAVATEAMALCVTLSIP
jgi:hypothetical protein